MTTRILFLTALLMASELRAQELTPAEFADSVEAGTIEAVELFDRGCPSDSAWADSALVEVEGRAEADPSTRMSLARAISARIADCSQADQDHAEDWVMGWVEGEYADPDAWYFHRDTVPMKRYLDVLGEEHHATYYLVNALAPFAAADSIQATLRKIACDIRLPHGIREGANGHLLTDRLAWITPPYTPRGWGLSIPPLRLEGGSETPKCEGYEPPEGE